MSEKLVRQFFRWRLFICLCIVSGIGYSASEPTSIEFVATVNGVAITKGLVDLNLNGAISQGAKDTPQLRQAIKEELINRELIAQEATRQGLDKNIDIYDQVIQLKQNLLIQAYVEDYLKDHPITESKLQQEYERQKKSLGASGASQYRVSQIALPSESMAIGTIKRLQNGDSFARVAKEISIDETTKNQGGSMGWLSPQQLPPNVAEVVMALKKGDFSTQPIHLQNTWVIVKIDDIRSAKISSFESSKAQLRQAIIQEYLTETLKRLRETARVVQ